MIRHLIPSHDERGSLAMAVLFILVGGSLTALIAPVMMSQIASTRQEVRRAHALHAAQSGLAAAVARIRAAVASGGGTGEVATGDVAKLPACGATVTGWTDTGRYEVTLHYLDVDPRGRSEQWATQNAVCSTGTPTRVPRFALLVSTGTGVATGALANVPTRTLHATYVFQTTDQPPPGGPIRAGVKDYAYAPTLCMDAGPAPWNTGRSVTMQRCVSSSARQRFAYHRDLTLVLVESKTTTRPLGLCIDGGSPHAVGNAVTLQNCQEVAPTRHRWSYNGSANFEGTTDGSTLDGYCLNIRFPNTVGSPVVLGRETDGPCGDPYSSRQAFAPYAQVGAGMANPPNTTGQLVNFKQFGRCLDIPNAKNELGHLIAWPCKQSPDGTNVGWNQVWILPTVTFNAAACGPVDVPCGRGTIRITAPPDKATPAGTYCVRSPGSIAVGQYVNILDTCPAGAPPADMTWTVYGETGRDHTRYHIKDFRGNCLEPSLTDFYTAGEQVGKIVLAPCADSDLQMWNAPANARDPSPLKDISEH